MAKPGVEAARCGAASTLVHPLACMVQGSSAPARVPDGRIVMDELPVRIAVVPGEADLVAQYLRDIIDALFAQDA